MVRRRGQREGIYSSFVAEVHNDLKVPGGGTNGEKEFVCVCVCVCVCDWKM